MHDTRIIVNAGLILLVMLFAMLFPPFESAADVSMSRISGDPDNPRRHFRLRQPAQVGPEEAERLYRVVRGALVRGYGESGLREVADYQTWTRYNSAPYLSQVHGNHYLNNYGNARADSYLEMRRGGLSMKTGAIIAKDSFAVSQAGEIILGPLAVMEKMPAGFNELSGDWKFQQIQPDGSLLGETNGRNSDRVRYCIACHQAREDYDYLFLFPEAPR